MYGLSRRKPDYLNKVRVWGRGTRACGRHPRVRVWERGMCVWAGPVWDQYVSAGVSGSVGAERDGYLTILAMCVCVMEVCVQLDKERDICACVGEGLKERVWEMVCVQWLYKMQSQARVCVSLRVCVRDFVMPTKRVPLRIRVFTLVTRASKN